MNTTLKTLEKESMNIIREAAKKNKKMIVMFSLGKDSTVLLHLIYKMYGNKIPFDVGYLDNGLEFPESYKFLKEKQKELNFNLVTLKTPPKGKLIKGSGVSCCGLNKAEGNKKLEKIYDALIIGIRKDENPARANDVYIRDKRVHPLLDWTEKDIWEYIKQNNIKVNELYFSKNGKRFRSIGCSNCSVPIKSDAKTVDEIIEEIKQNPNGERAGRDKEKEQVMQKLRAFGYM
ncbi:MAG: phosphoadenosine phosphosulfate reductase family protein [Candidatus Parvarchaeota archaeon]